MEDKDLDKIFQDAFIDAEELPNPHNWKKIEASLGKMPQVTPIRFIKKIGTIAASISLICLGGYYGAKFVSSNNTDSPINDEAINHLVENHHVNTAPSKENKFLTENEKPITDLATSNKIHKISSIENKSQAIENGARNPLQPAKLELLNERNIVLTSVEPNIPNKEELVIIQVTEIDDIKPLIEFEEEEETMLASTFTDIKENKNIVTTVLNKLSENLGPNKEQTVRFVADEEGSFAINITNTFAKNRNKKRK